MIQKVFVFMTEVCLTPSKSKELGTLLLLSLLLIACHHVPEDYKVDNDDMVVDSEGSDGDTDTDTDVDGDTGTDTDGDTDGDGDTDTDTDTDGDGDTDTDTDVDGDTGTDGDGDTDTDTDVDGDTDTDTDGDGDTDTDIDVDGDTDTDGDGDTDTDTDGDGDTDTDTDVDGDTDTDADTDADGDSDADEQRPFGGKKATIPGMIEAENYDEGGPGIAYYDTTLGNIGGAYRKDDVDIQSADKTFKGHSVTWIEDGEWLEYTVDARKGIYDILFRVSSGRAFPGTIVVRLDGLFVGSVDVRPTGSWFSYKNQIAKRVVVQGGTDKILRLEFLGSGMNVNWLKFVEVE